MKVLKPIIFFVDVYMATSNMLTVQLVQISILLDPNASSILEQPKVKDSVSFSVYPSVSQLSSK